MDPSEFSECIRMLRSDDPMTFEEGYHWIQYHFEAHLDELIEFMRNEQDARMRGRFVELLGDSKDLKVLPYLERELEHQDREVRSWAYHALTYFGDALAVQIAQKYKNEHPNEEFI